MEEFNLNQLIHLLPEYFQPERADGVDVSIQAVLTGDKGGDCFVTIRENKCTVIDGIGENPTLTIEALADDIFQMLDGSLDPMVAFMTGKLRLKGDRSKALKLISLFKIDSLPF